MERKIGEIFEYQGKKLKVIEGENKCDKCYFYKDNYCTRIDRIAGQCLTSKRTDNKSVNFIEVTEEQPQELNLCKILKNCPKETELYSPMYGKVYFNCVFNSGDDSIIYCYKTRLREGCTRSTNSQCTDIVAFYNNGTTGNPDFNITSECMLFPSATQRDWSKFTTPWYEKERFDPRTFKPFDKVLAKIFKGAWYADFISVPSYEICNIPILIGDCDFDEVIPYNDDTKQLLGTTDEAPDYYKYWED